MINKVEICGVNTASLPVLSREEKNELFQKIKKGDQEARDTFVKGNLRLVLSVIQRFHNRGENADDLFQVGCIGLINTNSREPTVSEIAKELDLSKEEVVFALDAIADPVSLFEPIYHDGGEAIYVMDQVRDKKNTDENWLESIALEEAMKHLNDREKHILTLRFFRGKTQMEVAEEIGISQAQVSRLEKSALKHMRKYV